MLDKTIPYQSIIMKCEYPYDVSDICLPAGFSFRFFCDGDEQHWSRIETSVLEFAATEEANRYYSCMFMPYREQLLTLCIFIENPDGIPVATATAWYVDSELGHQAALHWVAVCPEYQGLGLGKAVVQKAMQVFQQAEPQKAVWLHTQTWSHKAIRLYASLGFCIAKTAKLASYDPFTNMIRYEQTELIEAIDVLHSIWDPCDVQQLVNRAL